MNKKVSNKPQNSNRNSDQLTFPFESKPDFSNRNDAKIVAFSSNHSQKKVLLDQILNTTKSF